jgi:hypothetical protein
MRNTIVALAALAALWLAYIVWPFASLFEVVRAAQAGDVAKIEQRVDFPALRRSLTGQLVATYARLAGARLDRGGMMAGISSSLADPLVEQLVTPAVLAQVMKSGWPKAVLPDQPVGVAGLDPDALGNVWQLYFNSDYGLGEVRFAVPVREPKAKQFRVRLALSGWTWKLTGLDLPHSLQERLARELIRQQGGREPTPLTN